MMMMAHLARVMARDQGARLRASQNSSMNHAILRWLRLGGRSIRLTHNLCDFRVSHLSFHAHLSDVVSLIIDAHNQAISLRA